jgi:hypothetical protein
MKGTTMNKAKISQIPTMLNGIYNHGRNEQRNREMLERIDRRTEVMVFIFRILFWVAITVATVHIAETIKFYNIMHNATMDCIAEERDFNGY